MEKELRINLTSTFDSKGIDSAKRSFSELERESLRAISSQKSISSVTSDAARSVDDLSERIGFMGHAYVGFQTIIATSSFMADLTKDAIHQADTWNLLEGRLRLVTDSTQQLVSVQADLFDIAQESRTGYEQNADLYARIARATQDLNKTQYENLDVTEAISKSFIVSGAASESAKAAVIQLGQGFASGTLRGEELNSVLEQAPRLAEAIADGMGVSVGKLKDMGAEGKLTAEKVYEAIRTQKNAIEKEFDQMPKTVSQSLVVLTNQMGLTIHEFDQMHGVTAGIAEAISGMTVVLSEHSGEIGDYVGYIGGAVVAILAWKIGTIALNGIQAAHTAYVTASTVATTSYSIATNTTTTAVTTLTARQVAANAAVGAWNKLISLNPYAIAGAAIIGVGMVLKDQADQMRDAVRRTAVDVENLSAKALQAKITYATMELDTVNKSIKDPSFMKSAFGNERIDLHRKVQLENELKAYGKQLQKLHEEASKPSTTNAGGKKSDPLSEKELKAAAKSAEEYAKNYKSLQDAIFGISASDHNKAIKSIEDQAKTYRDNKMPEVEIARYVSESKSALNRKELDTLGKAMTESRKIKEKEWEDSESKDTEKTLKRWEDSKSALLSYYETIGDTKGAFEITESDRMQKLAEAGILSNEQMLAVWDKDNEKFQKEQWEKDNEFWVGLFDNIDKAMESQFFDAMTGRFESFGSWLKDFWASITDSMARGLSKTLADYVMGGVKGGVQNVFSSFGGLGAVFGSAATPAALLGSNTDSSGFTTTSGGTVFDAAGQITKAGSDSESVISALSNAKSLYSLATEGITGMLYAPSAFMGNLAGTAYGAGFTGTGSFLAGGANVLAGGGVSGLSGAAYAGGLATAGIAGGLGGYALGSIGDRLLGADTRAGSYGAIGGSIGAIAGSIIPGLGTLVGGAIGAALGSVIGGMFGKTKQTGSGLMAWGDMSSSTGFDSLNSYADFRKKSWFKSSSWTEYYGLDEKTKKQVAGIFTTYDYLLGQLGDLDTIIVGAGKYSGSTFFSAVDKAFIRAFIDNPSLTDTLYSAWTSYASEIGKSVQETFASLVSGYIDYTRGYEKWMLEAGGNTLESLKLQSQWAQSDYEAMSNLYGISGITVENYLDEYSKAIKSNFTPETITQWQSLGDALMKATDANQKYTDSLKELTDSSVKPIDMMLARLGASKDDVSIRTLVDQNVENSEQTSQMVASLYEVVKVLKQQYNLLQFGANQGVPA